MPEEKNVSWCACFQKFADNETGISLAAARHKEGITQIKLEDLSGIPQRHISEIENGKRPIGKKNAKIFGKILKIDYRLFL